MNAKLFLPLGLCLLLSACGTMQIDIDYGWTPQVSGSQPAQITATPTVQTATPSPSALPAQSSTTGYPDTHPDRDRSARSQSGCHLRRRETYLRGHERRVM